MRLYLVLATVALCAITSDAIRIPVKQAKRSASVSRRRGGSAVSVFKPNVLAASSGDSDSGLDLKDVHDLIYLADVNLGGTNYTLQLDTGSSDLWVKGSSTPLPNTNPTSQTYNLTYGIGWAYGHISYAPVDFANISVPSQAFLDVSSAQNPALSYGAQGILGLGFTSLSTIDAVINASSASTGRSFLYNLFQDNPKEPNFIAMSLQRSADKNTTIEGTFAVGEYDPDYKAVADMTAISTWPVNSPSRWNVLLDAVLIGNQTITPSTAVNGAPSDKAVVLLDSGTSWTYAPEAICDAIYGGISGARYDSGLGQWVVPCDAEIDMALQFNGQVYPLHPLDVSPVSTTDPSTCIGTFVPQAVTVGKGEFDWLIGDNVLRSVYTVYDFGDFDSSGKMGNPYVKLLSLVDPDSASADFHAIRGGTPNTNITYNAASGSSSSTTITLTDDVANTISTVGKYFPAVLAILALNAVLLIVLVVGAAVFLCKRKKTRRTRGRKSPMPMNRSSQAYQPVSIGEDSADAPPEFRDSYRRNSAAPVDDPFTPPGSARGSSFKDRPESTAYPPSSDITEHDLGAPVPAFRGGAAERPRSTVSTHSVSPLSPPAPSFRSFEGSPGDRPKSFAPSTHVFREGIVGDRPMSAAYPSHSSAPIAGPSSPATPVRRPFNVSLQDRPMSAAYPPPQPQPSSPLQQQQQSPLQQQQQSALSPPVPAFRAFNGNPGDRPRSAMYPGDAGAGEDELVPPSAGFRNLEGAGSRPRSMA
ncbi:hypothetical protein PLICRDRAFT_48168 [Plicaturopsis crispa FD-325 SS-3]|nr:hypothetical protein PLICRDRAFT_48168 [Plicaturopsis crispa FD-325 SS-3]